MSDKEDLNEFNTKVSERKNDYDDDSVTGWDQPEVAEASLDNNNIGPKLMNTNARMWAMYGHTFSPCEESVNILPDGQYTIEFSNDRGIYFSKREINLDDLMILPDSASEQVIAEIETFWTKEQHFRDFGFLWKRGVLLWGPPGSGKTSTVQLISAQIVAKGGIAVYVQNPAFGALGLEMMRRIEPDRPIVVIVEDIDAVSQRYGEADLLALLDGELQIDNVVFIATTNYPERLDKRLTNRPSRFDIVKKIGMPSTEAREIYLRAKNPRLDHHGRADELNNWIHSTKGFSLAHIKELIISVEVFEVSLRDATERLAAMMNLDISSDNSHEKEKVGFIKS